MNENKKQSGDWKMIIGGIALIIVLFMGVKLLFWGLEAAIPQNRLNSPPPVSASQSPPAGSGGEETAPSFCIHCGRALPESFQWGQFCPCCGEKMEGGK
ncbi:MAG: hypothetical protein HFF52_01945 [Lawsonibacter sp.]|nr:hypothetical protein [Lawsonibacter sp.]